MAKRDANHVRKAGQSDGGKPPSDHTKDDAKKKRLADALRENLKRRKTQASQRKNKP
jgi:hypothetical protein